MSVRAAFASSSLPWKMNHRGVSGSLYMKLVFYSKLRSFGDCKMLLPEKEDRIDLHAYDGQTPSYMILVERART